MSNRALFFFFSLLLFDYCCFNNEQFPSESDYVYLFGSFLLYFLVFVLRKTGNLAVVINYTVSDTTRILHFFVDVVVAVVVGFGFEFGFTAVRTNIKPSH